MYELYTTRFCGILIPMANTTKRTESKEAKRSTGRPRAEEKEPRKSRDTANVRGNGSGRASARERGPVRDREPVREPEYETHADEILLILTGALTVFLFLCNFGICGTVGNALRYVMFGLFGLPAYVLPPLAFFAAFFAYANGYSRAAKIKIGGGIGALTLISMICELAVGRITQMDHYSLPEIFSACGKERNGGGVIAGSLTYGGLHTLSFVGLALLLAVGLIVCTVLITGRSFLKGLQRGGRYVAERTSREMQEMRERGERRRRIQEKRRIREEEERKFRIEQQEDEKVLRRDRKADGVTWNTKLDRDRSEESDGLRNETDLFVPDGRIMRDDVHQITVHRYGEEEEPEPENAWYDRVGPVDADADNVRGNIREIAPEGEDETETEYQREPVLTPPEPPAPPTLPEPAAEAADEPKEVRPKKPKRSFFDDPEEAPPAEPRAEIKERKPAAAPAQPEPKKKAPAVYRFPPIDLLHKGKKSDGDSDENLKDTAGKLEEILKTFGVNARVTDISQGPTVTRYELQPEAGVKVSKILGLTDDIKLNLAATDIRIEAPIPGKAAVGIEVPNRSVATVYFRDVVDTQDFRAFKSRLAFGVGKDLAGKPVIADIAKMPHVLIAGATGSGKSVCINTIIMSILYKATPEEVRLIMIDPKVVELSVYNGIPHLLIPVVTEPQKAAAALNWAVAEMTKRYKLFADSGVRDLSGYNAHLEKSGEGTRLPQILVIVDELADLMMTCANDVEAAIVRLTQLARAAGIHLVIATQRPSVDVITGLIKANMPSRVAFAVTSNTDSRTILDMVGAERLLGKGDMLFFPQGYTRPARVQGAFVSDEEVADVTAFIREQGYEPADQEKTQEEMERYESAGGNLTGAGGSDGGDGRDAFFADAARLVIGKDKASIGMLQRVFKVGFNRAARIMDQLCEAGVVSEEEGTKPRKVLMSQIEFEELMKGGSDEN